VRGLITSVAVDWSKRTPRGLRPRPGAAARPVGAGREGVVRDPRNLGRQLSTSSNPAEQGSGR